MVGGKWEGGAAGPDRAADMARLIALYADQDIPRGLPYDLQQAERRLPVAPGFARQSLQPLHLAETRRILLQKKLIDKQSDGDSPIELSVKHVGLAETARRLIVARSLGGGL